MRRPRRGPGGVDRCQSWPFPARLASHHRGEHDDSPSVLSSVKDHPESYGRQPARQARTLGVAHLPHWWAVYHPAMALNDDEEAALRAELAAAQAMRGGGGDAPVIIEQLPERTAEVIAAEAAAAVVVIAAQADAEEQIIEARAEADGELAERVIAAEVKAEAAADDGGLSPDSSNWYFGRRKRRNQR